MIMIIFKVVEKVYFLHDNCLQRKFYTDVLYVAYDALCIND